MPSTPREAQAVTANWEMHKDDGQKVTTRPNGHKRVQTINKSKSLTQQSDREFSELKQILSKYEMTGVMEHLRNVDLEFRDITTFTDYHEAMREAERAKVAFMELPSKVREAFEHDHGQWLDAAEDGLSEAQTARLIKSGYLPAPEPAPVTAPTEEPAPPVSE